MTVGSSYPDNREEHQRHASANYDRQVKVVTVGIDVGSTTSKVVIMNDGKVLAYSNTWNVEGSTNGARKTLDAALSQTGITEKDIQFVIATGCGESNISLVNRTLSDIICHSRGVWNDIGASLRTVLIMGGRDCVAVSCKDTGAVASFVANACPPSFCREGACNACGAAQGKAIDAVADLLGIPIREVGALSLSITDEQLAKRLSVPFDARDYVYDEMPPEIREQTLNLGGPMPIGGALSVVCAVLAKAQAAGLLRNGWSKAEILAVYCAALAHQAALLVKRIGVKNEFALTGGVAKNIGVVSRLEKELGTKVVPLKSDPQITAALGAALYAEDFARNARNIAHARSIARGRYC